MSVIKACIDRFRNQKPLPKEMRENVITADAFWWKESNRERNSYEHNMNNDINDEDSTIVPSVVNLYENKIIIHESEDSLDDILQHDDLRESLNSEVLHDTNYSGIQSINSQSINPNSSKYIVDGRKDSPSSSYNPYVMEDDFYNDLDITLETATVADTAEDKSLSDIFNGEDIYLHRTTRSVVLRPDHDNIDLILSTNDLRPEQISQTFPISGPPLRLYVSQDFPRSNHVYADSPLSKNQVSRSIEHHTPLQLASVSDEEINHRLNEQPREYSHEQRNLDDLDSYADALLMKCDNLLSSYNKEFLIDNDVREESSSQISNSKAIVPLAAEPVLPCIISETLNNPVIEAAYLTPGSTVPIAENALLPPLITVDEPRIRESHAYSLEQIASVNSSSSVFFVSPASSSDGYAVDFNAHSLGSTATNKSVNFVDVEEFLHDDIVKMLWEKLLTVRERQKDAQILH